MNQAFPIFLHFLAGIFGAIGQYFYKKGGERLSQVPLWQNWSILLGILSFCLVMVLFVLSYRQGARISTVYPVYATTFVWGAMLGYWLDNEPLNATLLSGIAIILLGVAVVGVGASR